MAHTGRVFGSVRLESQGVTAPTEPCVLVIFGASGDLTRRLLFPALYNLACDGLLSERFTVLGTARTQMNTAEFRARMGSTTQGIRRFHTREGFDPLTWDTLANRSHYISGSFEEPQHFETLRERIAQLDRDYKTGGNVLFYLATAPALFSTICDNLHAAGLHTGPGWRRVIVEKPFGSDFASAQELNRKLLTHWDESQIYRVDHYLGKETVQNLLAFRFSNGMFEPLWNANFIDNIQISVCESVAVEGRGAYYDSAGALRDMIQNHMFQILAYIGMEPPPSFTAEAIRDEKSKLLGSVHIYEPEEVAAHVVRGQYGPSFNEQGQIVKAGYRQERNVDPQSDTETFLAARLLIDNWRWAGVPIYLRSGKALCKRSTEVVVQFKKAPQTIFQGTPVDHVGANRLVFHIQPYQGIDLLFQAKTPGLALDLQTADMRFSYADIFKAPRQTGYEILIHSCTHGDGTLFSRGDLIESAWRVVQPILDHWQTTPTPEFPNYSRGTWGPKAAHELIERDKRRWFEVVTPDLLQQSPLFQHADPLLLNAVIMALHPATAAAGDTIIAEGDPAEEMYLICRGEVEIVDDAGNVLNTLKDGDFFGEIGLLLSTPRTATVKAKTLCDLFVLQKAALGRILSDHPQFAGRIMKTAQERYDVIVSREDLMGSL